MGVPTNSVKVAGQGVFTADQWNTETQTVDTAATLRTFVGLSNMCVTLQGISAPGDGLGGLFRGILGSAVDDNLNTIVPTGQTGFYWTRIPISTTAPGSLSNAAIEFRLDGGGSTPSTGVVGDQCIPYPFTIKGWTVQADQPGAISLDIWAASYVNSTPPTIANSIVGTNPPGFASGESYQGLPTAWSAVTFPANTWLRHNITTISTVTRYTLTLAIVK